MLVALLACAPAPVASPDPALSDALSRLDTADTGGPTAPLQLYAEPLIAGLQASLVLTGACPSEQVCTQVFGVAAEALAQLPAAQSRCSRHALFAAQAPHTVPPQSTSVSSPSFVALPQCRPETALVMPSAVTLAVGVPPE